MAELKENKVTVKNKEFELTENKDKALISVLEEIRKELTRISSKIK